MGKYRRKMLFLIIVALIAVEVINVVYYGKENTRTVFLEKQMNVQSVRTREVLPEPPDTPDLSERYTKIVTQTAADVVKIPTLVEYKGPIKHIFFHPLIVYPERAFDGDSLSEGYNEWFVTVREFVSILESLYTQNYILIDTTKLYETVLEDGKTIFRQKKLLLPEGKKPLILSIDDLNYYKYMKENGNAFKLVLDKEGNAATYSVSPDGRECIARDNEIVPLLDAFVEQHPDFSQDGAKGIIALTGYEGILGYSTQEMDVPGYEKEKLEALQVVKRLKETGWAFACHGYGHLDAKKAGLEKLLSDTRRWKTQVEPLTGPSSIYIYPYGSELAREDPKLKMLINEGFQMFYGVGSTGFFSISKNYVSMDRMNIDGIAFHYRKDKLADMFAVDSVIDSVRPPLKLAGVK
jgi:hypothetical protein